MKKFLSAFLAVLMVLSMVATSMVTVFAAEAAEEVKSVLVSNGEDINADQSKNGASQTGWRNHKAYISLMNGAAGMKIAAGSSVTDLRFHYLAKATVDTTKFSYVEFDLYLSDAAAIAGINHFALELTSGGKEDDANEFQYLWDDLSALKTGWNHVKVPFTSFTTTGTFDATKWNFVRFFAAAGDNYAKDLVIAIDNFGFSDGTETPAEAKNEIALPGADTTVLGWEVIPEKWNMCFDLETPDKSNACLIRTWTEGSYATNGVNMFWIIENGDGTCKNFDVSTADSFAIDIWVSDAALFTGKSFQIELGNGGFGAIDTNEATYNGSLDALVEGGLKTGWNTVVLPFTSTTATGNGADWTKIDWFRLYNNDTITAGADGMQIAIDNVRFVKGDKVVAVMSTCEPSTNGWSASFVEIKDSVVFGKTTAADKFAICDIYWDYTMAVGYDTTNMKYIEYDLYISDVEAIKDVTLYMEMTSSGIYDQQESGRNVKIGDMGLKNGWNHVKFELANLSDTANSGTAGGALNRANFNYFRLYTIDEANLTAAVTVALDNVRVTDATDPACEDCQVVHAINLPKPGTSVSGWSWAPNFAIKAQGSASVLSVLEANKTYAPASSGKVIEAFRPGAAGAVDASEADSFVFEFYVSNAEVLKALNVELELSSNPNGGDQNEMRYVSKTLDAVIEGGMKNGWNTVVIPKSALSSGSDHLSDEALKVIDWSKISYFRMYFLGNIVTGDDGLVYGFDNLRFTKEGEVVATLTDCEPNMNGWERDGVPYMLGDTLVQGVKFTENVGGGAGFNFLFLPGADYGLDVTGMEYFEFDWYVSDAAAVANTTFVFELTSSGLPDNEEIGKIFTGSDLGLKKGWNHIKFKIADLADTAGKGAFRPEQFNMLRLFNNDGITVNGELVMAFLNVAFTDGVLAPNTPENPETPDVPETPDDPEVPGDAETKEDLYEFQIDNGTSEAPYLDPDYKANWNGTLRFADGAQYFIYKYDLTAFRGVQSITFAGNFGGQYHIWASADGKNWIEIAKRSETNAVSLELDLSELADDVANTMTLYVKIGDSDTSNGNGGNMQGNVQLKVVYDANADQTRIEPVGPQPEHEKDVFELNSAEEEAHLVAMTGKWNGTKRYADGNAIFTYKYTIKNVYQVTSVIWKAATNQELKLCISFDNENWINIYSTEENLPILLREYDLTEYLVDENGTIANATFYLRISDTDPSDGWGGGIHNQNPVTLDVEYTPLTAEQMDAIEATVTEHRIPLWGANKSWGDIYELDTENQVAGSGCISANLKGVKDTHAPSKSFESIDATGMDTFEFYVYLSDLAIVDHLKNNTGSGSVELCSGGKCDQGEKSVALNQIFTDFVVGELSTGWNLIAIPLNRMSSTPGDFGEFQINNINYIRIFWSGMTNPTDQDWVIKFDNFAMTDRQAEIEREKEAFRIHVLEKNAGLIANIDALKEITELTAENITSAKAKLSNVKSAFEALPKEEQDILIAAGYKKTINEFQKLVDAYVEAPECTEHVDADKNGKCDNCDADVEVKVECTEHVDADKNGKCDNCDATVEVGGGTTTTPGEEGCKSSMTIGAVATMILAGAWVSIAARKKED